MAIAAHQERHKWERRAIQGNRLKRCWVPRNVMVSFFQSGAPERTPRAVDHLSALAARPEAAPTLLHEIPGQARDGVRRISHHAAHIGMPPPGGYLGRPVGNHGLGGDQQTGDGGGVFKCRPQVCALCPN